MSHDSRVVRDLEELDEGEVKNRLFELTGDGPDPGQTYGHQIEGLRRIEAGADRTPPVSGILHYPTGAGKTRVGMQLVARALTGDPQHRFIWATHTKNLLRQSMVRLAELSALFPAGTRFMWADVEEVDYGEEDPHIVFLTRNALRAALDWAGDGRVNHPWRQHLEGRAPMTLIYDECHQLGAAKLQRAMHKFYVNVVAPPGVWRRRWRVIGLSATPVPTQHAAHELIADVVFPVRKDIPSASREWPFHVFQRIDNGTLIQQGILCPINTYLDETGEFNIPLAMLKKVIGDARLKAPGSDADPIELQKYALQFNSKVMADPRVVEFLAAKIGENLGAFGKTIVFVPNIEAANRMTAALYERFRAYRGKVAAVHTKMDELDLPGQRKAAVHEVLSAFRKLGDEPSVLVNVDMLTEGFDDPKVRTVVLARLTLSTNRFWQMIGRGTRGPATQPSGTADCQVIDPLKLTRVYDYFSGYQPSFAGDRNDVEFEELGEEPGEDRISPEVPAVVRPPEPRTGVYSIDSDLERVHGAVASALRHFLSGDVISEKQAIEVARRAKITLSAGQMVLGPSCGEFDPTTAMAILLGEVSSLERRASADLGWFRRQLPVVLNESLLKQRMRMLRAIESMALWTESAFAEAQLRGDFLAAMRMEAQGIPEPSATVAAAEPTASPIEEAVLDALLAMAGADGRVVDAEVYAILESLRRMFGKAATPELEGTVRRRSVPAAIPVENVERLLAAGQRQLLLIQLAEVAAADRIVVREEHQMLESFGERLGVSPAFVGAVLGSYVALAGAGAATDPRSPPLACPACSSGLPAEAAYCPFCGIRLR